MNCRTTRPARRLFAVACLAVAITSCSAGQLAQTSLQVGSVGGVPAEVGDLSLRNVQLEYPSAGTYQAGDDANLEFVVVNNNVTEDDRLVSVSSSAAASGEVGQGDSPVDLPASSLTQFTDAQPSASLLDLTDGLDATVTIPVTFTFARAGAITILVPVGVPLQAQDRTDDFNFDTGE